MSGTANVQVLGRIDAVPAGESRVFQVAGRDIAVFRCRTGDVYAADASCPHRGGPLADGLVGNHSVICPMHGYVFDLRTGEPSGQGCPRLVTHRVAVGSDGALTLEVS